MVTEEQQWYVQKGSHVQGPYTTNEVGRYLLLGRVRNTDRVSKDGELWEPVTQVPELIPEELLNLDTDMGWKKYLQTHQQHDERQTQSLAEIGLAERAEAERRQNTPASQATSIRNDWVTVQTRIRPVSLLPLCLLGVTLMVLLLVIYINSTSHLL